MGWSMTMQTVRLPDGATVPALGQGTWMMGERSAQRAREVAALREGIELGMTVIDTAEMYADGESERLVGEAIKGRRDKVFLVSKAYPHNASLDLLPAACEASLKRLGTEHLDLYLLHWRGTVPLAETIEAMELLVTNGRIVRWGVSNLDTIDMAELISAGGERCATDQILYNLSRRGPEFELMPWLAERSIPIMAYSPVEQGRLLDHEAITRVMDRTGASAAQIALAWLLRRNDVIAIPKAGTLAHVVDNRGAAEINLGEEDLVELERAFPPSTHRQRLEML
jgi:diketogulonate reductase-like aldo/keto reductase